MLREPQKVQQTNEPRKEPKRRFQIVKLEERVAPSNSGSDGKGKGCDTGVFCTGTCFKC